jgi:hypothetical protein
MSVREFLRGGYQGTEGTPVVVVNGNAIAGSWYPGTSGIEVAFPGTHAIAVGRT